MKALDECSSVLAGTAIRRHLVGCKTIHRELDALISSRRGDGRGSAETHATQEKNQDGVAVVSTLATQCT